MSAKAAPRRIGSAGLTCPCCGKGLLAFWSGERGFFGRVLRTETVRCDECGAETTPVIVRGDGPYREELLARAKRMHDRKPAIKQ